MNIGRHPALGEHKHEQLSGILETRQSNPNHRCGSLKAWKESAPLWRTCLQVDGLPNLVFLALPCTQSVWWYCCRTPKSVESHFRMIWDLNPYWITTWHAQERLLDQDSEEGPVSTCLETRLKTGSSSSSNGLFSPIWDSFYRPSV